MKLIKKFQMGGQVDPNQVEEQNMPVEQATEAPGDPMEQVVNVIMQLAEAGSQALQSQDPQALSQVVQALVQFSSDLQTQLGGQTEVPTFKKGGVFSKMKKVNKTKTCKK